MAFYADMSEPVVDLLKPDYVGGLGQGPITVVHRGAPTVNPAEPWEKATIPETREDVNQVATRSVEYRSGETVGMADLAYFTVPTAEFVTVPGDVIEEGGVKVATVVHVETLKSADHTVYTKLYCNR